MKKTVLFPVILAILAVFILPSVLAIDVHVATNSSNLVLIKELNEPVSFNVSITNNGPSDSFHIYNLVGFLMSPTGSFFIPSGGTKVINATITPVANMTYSGYYTFNYFVQDSSGNHSTESVTFLVTNLQGAFSVGASDINPESNSIQIYIKNNVNHNFKSLDVNFKSPFFALNKQISLAPYDEKYFTITLDKTDFKSLLAGFYTLSADVNDKGISATVEGNIKFSEKDIVSTSESDTGFIIFTKAIKKTNNGNVVANTETIIKKNIISRLFTTFSQAPDSVSRQGLNVYYTWIDKVQPGDTLTITATTNWLLPLFVIIFIIAIVVAVKLFSRTSLVMDKKVSFLHAKGGEFALKITVAVSAKKFVERLTVTDRLPPLVKLYEKFGIEKPSRVDEKNRRIEWYFDRLESGETRVLSYVIYSKVGVVGRFALPTATAIFERNGKILEAQSNRAFLVAEQGVARED